MSNQDANILLRFIRDILEQDNVPPLNTMLLSSGFRELGDNLNYLNRYIMEMEQYAGAISQGIFPEKAPDRANRFCWPLKALCSNLMHLAWQTQQIAHGDYEQHVDFLGEFSESFNIMVEQLKQREVNLKLETSRAAKKIDTLKEANDLLYSIMNNILGWVIVIGTETGEILFVNQTAKDEFKKHPEISEEVCKNLSQNTISAGKRHHNISLLVHDKSEIQKMYQVNMFHVFWKGTEANACIIYDITQQQNIKILEQGAYTDSLTGIYNRRYCMDSLERNLEGHKQFSVCFLDIDHLKFVNDCFGHLEGDQYIRLVVRALQQVFGEDDIICRIGGDEFAIISGGDDAGILEKNMEKTENALLRLSLTKKYAMSVSYGIISIGHNSTLTTEDILHKADEQMYIFKKAQYKAFASKIPPTPNHSAIQYDTITKFPVYSSFEGELANYFIEGEYLHQQDKKTAIMYLDILDFKALNEYYGYAEGDRELFEIAELLREKLDIYTGTRIFSDFFILLFSMDKKDTLEQLAKKLVRSFRIFLKDQRVYHPKCKIEIVAGLCEVEDGFNGLNQAIDNANEARKIAKASYRTECLVFNSAIKRKKNEEARLNAEIKTALANRDFSFCLQPKVSLTSGRIVGAEALVRMSENNAMIYPGEFLPLMERDGSITELDFQVYDKVCHYLYQRIREGLPVVPVSINVSRLHLRDETFADNVHSLIQSYNIKPPLIEFELTENIFFDEVVDRARHIITKLRSYGYQISIDDFGAGYSSTNLLLDLDFDVLKLDKSLVDYTIEQTRKSEVIISSLISMAKRLDIKVVCEGVETLGQLEFVKKMGCDIVQGYYFLKPVELRSFEKMLEQKGGYCPLPWDNEVVGQ